MDTPETQWIRSLLTAETDGIAVGGVSRADLVAAGRARLVRRRALAGAALAVAAVLATTGYAIASPDGPARPGHTSISASTTPAPPRSATPAERVPAPPAS